MAKEWKVKGIKPKKSYRWNARVILPVRVEEVYSWEPYIHDPENVEELHNLRISVKRLRYSMEFFAGNLGKPFETLLNALSELQELLGDIHDCDVIDEVLTDYLEHLPAEHVERDAIGINALMSSYRQMRKAKYEAFIQRWDELERTDFRGALLKIVKRKSKKG